MIRLPSTAAVIAALTLLLLAGCAGNEPDTTPQPEPQPEPQPDPMATAAQPGGEPQWWQVRFRIAEDPQHGVAWYVDALLADQVLAPLLHRYRYALPLWRVHRRAAADSAGHQLSALFFTDAATAARIRNALGTSAALGELEGAGIVRAVLLPQDGDGMGDALSATSDRNWPAVLQRTWPTFIMGVSQHWLALIAELRTAHEPLPRRDLDALLAVYQQINQEIDALWRSQGQHAYLHHLNALFGYQPLLLQEHRLTRF